MRPGLQRAVQLLGVLFFCAWLYTKLAWPSTFTDTPELLANLYAKEMCTCRYVVGQSLERCFENHAIIRRPSHLEWDEKNRSVRVRVFWAHSSAHVVSERFGCVRDNFPNDAH